MGRKATVFNEGTWVPVAGNTHNVDSFRILHGMGISIPLMARRNLSAVCTCVGPFTSPVFPWAIAHTQPLELCKKRPLRSALVKRKNMMVSRGNYPPMSKLFR